MIGIEVRSNVASAIKDLGDVNPAKFRTAVARALNRTAAGVRTDAAKDIRQRYAITGKDLSPAFHVYRASPQYLVAKVSATGRPLALMKFRPTPDHPRRKGEKLPRKGGVSVTIKRGARKTVRGSFVARMPTGHVGVFRRTGPARDATIKELTTVSVPEMFGANVIQDAINAAAADRFDKALAQQIKFLDLA